MAPKAEQPDGDMIKALAKDTLARMAAAEEQQASRRMGAVKTTPPPSTEEASFGAEMAAMPDPHGAPWEGDCAGPPPGEPSITLGQAIQDLTEQREHYGISPAEDMRKAFDEAAAAGDPGVGCGAEMLPAPSATYTEAMRRRDVGIAAGFAAKVDADLTKVVQEDAVNSPAHYNEGGVECIDAIKAALGDAGFQAMCHGTAIKYLWRARHKKRFEEDMKKAIWYARMAIGDDPRDDDR